MQQNSEALNLCQKLQVEDHSHSV